MKLILDDVMEEEIIDFLMDLDGVIEVKKDSLDYITTLDIKHNNNISPKTILKSIYVFQQTKYPSILGFDKGSEFKSSSLKYTVDDMCCDYCYKGLVQDLFDNDYIKSVKSDFTFGCSMYKVKFDIEYDTSISEETIIKYIKEQYN